MSNVPKPFHPILHLLGIAVGYKLGGTKAGWTITSVFFWLQAILFAWAGVILVISGDVWFLVFGLVALWIAWGSAHVAARPRR